MAKTLVAALHEPGPFENGVGGCQARWGNSGMCPGVQNAQWLNDLGEDEEIYISYKNGEIVTIGLLRDRWLNGNQHLVAVDPSLARLRAERRRLKEQLRITEKEIKRLEEVRG